MSSLGDAHAHLAKAKEFLEAAEMGLDLDLFNAAASNDVISGINSKDAICLRLSGTSNKTDNHSSAVVELRRVGGAGPYGPDTKRLATVLGRLLQLKSRSQYQTVTLARSDAIKAVDWAHKMLDGAIGVVND